MESSPTNPLNTTTSVQHGVSMATVGWPWNIINTTSNTTQDDDYYYYYDYPPPPPYQIRPISIEIPFKSYVYPILAIVTIIGNILTVSVFVKERMRTATTMLLVGLAVSDSVICSSILPKFLYLYPTGNYLVYVPYRWCVALQVLSSIYRVARTTSNWITAAIGIQRCIIVKVPFRAKRICTVKSSVLACVFITIASVLVHLLQFVAIAIIPLTPVSVEENVTMQIGCVKQFPKWVIETFEDMKKMTWMHYLLTGILTRLLPCLILTITTLLVVLQLRKRKKNLGSDTCHGVASDKDVVRVTRLVVAILVVFLLAETQDIAAFSIYVYEITSDQTRQVMSRETDRIWDTFTVLAALLSYHVNFWIYLLMSKEFRVMLRNRFCPGYKFPVSKRDDKMTTSSFLPESSTSQPSCIQKEVDAT